MSGLLVDEGLLGEFFDCVVPELNDEECLVMFLVARKKYYPELPRSEEVVRREVIRRKDWGQFLRKVKRICTVEGLYTDKNGSIIPREAFAVYIDLDPKNAVKAWVKLQKEMCDYMYQLSKGNREVLREFRRLDVRWFSWLHRSNSTKLYWLIDIDVKDEDLLENVVLVDLGDAVAWVSETRNGYHVIVHNFPWVSKKLFKEIIGKYKNVEVKKQVQTPLPGTLQGGFLVKPVKWWSEVGESE